MFENISWKNEQAFLYVNSNNNLTIFNTQFFYLNSEKNDASIFNIVEENQIILENCTFFN